MQTNWLWFSTDMTAWSQYVKKGNHSFNEYRSIHINNVSMYCKHNYKLVSAFHWIVSNCWCWSVYDLFTLKITNWTEILYRFYCRNNWYVLFPFWKFANESSLIFSLEFSTTQSITLSWLIMCKLNCLYEFSTLVEDEVGLRRFPATRSDVWPPASNTSIYG